MVRIKILSSIIIFLLQFIFSKELEIGEKIPLIDHTLVNINGKSITLKKIRGKNGTLVIFSCNTCPWVIRWEGRYVDIANRYIKKGIGSAN